LDARLLRFRNRPGSEDAASLAEALLSAERLTEALEVASVGLSRAPNDARLLVVQGRGLFHEGDLLQAQAALLKAARIASASKEPFRWLGEVLLRRGDPQRALKVLERAAKPACSKRPSEGRSGRRARRWGWAPRRWRPRRRVSHRRSRSSASRPVRPSRSR
jgi:tetratricopeptide (TPR) repeat protein